MRLALTLLMSAVVLGASQVSAGAWPPAEPPAQDASARLESLNALDQRVARVAARLWSANADLCPVQQRGAGWMLHAASLYSGELRPEAQRRWGLRGDLPGVLAAPAGTAAAEAGLRPGDLVLGVGDQQLAAGATGRQSYQGFAANVLALDRALSRGPQAINVQRGEQVLTLTVRPKPTCGYEVQLDPSSSLNAKADRRRVYLNTALAAFAQTDDELALVLAHELAHAVLRHRPWNDPETYGRTRNPAAPVQARLRDREAEADRVGLWLLARACYDPDVGPSFWRRFGAANWQVRLPQIGHASAGTRARALEAVAAEISRRRQAGEPLLP